MPLGVGPSFVDTPLIWNNKESEPAAVTVPPTARIEASASTGDPFAHMVDA
jgi:hypothetical protein